MKAAWWRPRPLSVAAALIFLAGAGLAGASAFQVAGERVEQHRLVQEWQASLPDTGLQAAPPAVSPSPGAQPPVPSGKWFLIRVPDAGYAEIVREGVDQKTLDGGPGHFPGTAWPGWRGNVGISVHNTYWLGVGRLQPGRTVVLETEYGVFTYRVKISEVVQPDLVGVFDQSGEQRLSITTCWPLWAGAAATQRLIMVADQVGAKWRIPPPA